MPNEPLDDACYQAAMRDLSKSYQFLSQDPSARNTSIGREAEARLSSLDRSLPDGPNTPMIRSIENLLE